MPDQPASTPPHQYPHVGGIEDWRAQQTTRLLWDRVFALDARLQAAEATVKTLGATLADQQRQITAIDRKASQALAAAALTPAERGKLAADAAGGGGSGKDDLGLGAEGCAAAGATGHLTEPFEKTVQNAGAIVCGVGNEFPALLAATATYAAREANREELMDRMVWHLNQAGFAASRYGTPGTDEHAFNLLLDCLALDGSGPVRQYAYLVVTYYPKPPDPWDPTNVMETRMKCNGQSPGYTTTPDAGIAD